MFTNNLLTMSTRSPFRKALKEVRTVVVPAFLLAVGFNLFASNGVPWIRTVQQLDSASDVDLFGSNDTGVFVEQAIDTMPGKIDTTDTIPEEEYSVDQDVDTSELTSDAEHSEEKPPVVDVPEEEDHGSGVKGITTEQAKKILDQENSIFIDARRSDQFVKGHISGALNIYAYEFENHIGDVIGIPKEKRIVVYCDGGECELSHDLSNDLINFGFKNVYIYTGGWEEWSTTDYPKATGE